MNAFEALGIRARAPKHEHQRPWSMISACGRVFVPARLGTRVAAINGLFADGTWFISGTVLPESGAL